MQRHLIFALAVCAAAAVPFACSDGSDGELGSDQEALQVDDAGQPICNSPKVLVCHIPPGNPANEHSICVGAPAVQAHQRHHGDKIGQACGNLGGSGGSGGAGGSGGGSGGAGGAGGTGGSAGTSDGCVGVSTGGACNVDADCCAGLACSNSTCIPLIN